MRRLVLFSALAVVLLPLRSAVAQEELPDDPWPEVVSAIRDQRFAEAKDAVEKRLAAAKAQKDTAALTRALVRRADLQVAMGQWTEAAAALKAERWPDDAFSRVVLDLAYANALLTWTQNDGYRLRQQQEITGSTDLSKWSFEQITAEAFSALADAFSLRTKLGDRQSLRSYVKPNDFPKEIRGTARDALTYVLADALGDSSYWTPAQSNGTELLSLDELLAPAKDPMAVLSSRDAHPLLKQAALYSDLQAFHQKAGRDEAAFEARRVWLLSLYGQFDSDADHARIRSALQEAAKSVRGKPWWAMGQASLAELASRDEPALARDDAAAGAKAFPDSVGGKKCAFLKQTLEQPELLLETMSADGPKKRSLLVTHRNVPKLYFRAYRLDFDALLSKPDGELFPAGGALDEVVEKQQPVARWEEDLPPTPDLRSHKTFITPPLEAPGEYAIVASTREDPKTQGAVTEGVSMLVSDLVVVSSELGKKLEITTLSGETGQPISGATVKVMRHRWDPARYQQLSSASSDKSGKVQLANPFGESEAVLVVSKGPHRAFLSLSYRGEESEGKEPALQSVVYTDRSVYRPQQKVLWKVVAYRPGKLGKGGMVVAPSTAFTVRLRDANYQEVAAKKVTSNEFGTASGEFEIPQGRLLGAWRLETSIEGEASIAVEEYKRPTFEVTLSDPASALRLNQPATINGEARYYFGLPLNKGRVSYQVTRIPRFPPWWGWFSRSGVRDEPQQIAAGTATLRPDGKFDFQFVPKADERKAKIPGVTYVYRVNVDVLDEGGETRSATRNFHLGFVSVEAQVTQELSFYDENTAPQGVQIVRHDLDGAPRAGKGSWSLVSIEAPEGAMLPADLPSLSALHAEGVDILPKPLTKGDALNPRWMELPSRDEILATWKDGKQLASGEVTHGADGLAKVSLPSLRDGVYRLRYTTKDDFGVVASTSSELVVVGKARPKLALELSVQREEVEAGQTARVLVTSGLPDQPLELQLKRANGKIERRSLNGSSAQLIEIPITMADRGGIELSLVGVRDHQLLKRTAEISVPWSDRKLELSFSTFRDEVRTGSKQSFRVTVKGNDGKPVEARAAEVLAYMYDRSLDLFAPHHPQELLALYPSWFEGFELDSSVNVESGAGVFSEFAPQFTPPPEFTEDSWRSLSGYGIGGPGARFRYSKMRSPAMTERRMNSIQIIRGGGKFKDGAPGRESEEDKKEEVEKAPPATGKAMATEEPAEKPPGALRKEFAETAFFQPHLLTDAEGGAAIEFTVPDSVTEWSMWAHALTKDFRAGSTNKTLRSINELMVREYAPRLLREGDRTELRAVVNNSTDKPLAGTVKLEVLDAATGKSIAKEMGLGQAEQKFSVGPKGSMAVSWVLKAPPSLGSIELRAVATSGTLSDGESRTIPVLPSRMHLAASAFEVLSGGGEKKLAFPEVGADPTRQSEKLVVTVDSQLFLSVLSAVPYLVEYPYECTEQTMNRFLSTGVLSSVFTRYPSVAALAKEYAARKTQLEAFDKPDPNRVAMLEEAPWLRESHGGETDLSRLHRVLDPKLAAADRDQALQKLQKMQMSDGSFPWFPGGPPSPFMTLYLLNGFARAAEFKVPVPKEMVTRAWGYVARHYREELVKKEAPVELLVYVAYVSSAFPDESWLGGAFTGRERTDALNRSFERWRELSPYLKSLLSLALKRAGRGDDASTVFASVMDTAKSDPKLGVYWQPSAHSWLWYEDTTESQAFALRTLTELSPKDPRRTGMVQWLFLDKKLNHWKSTRATAEAIYALVHYLDSEKQLNDTEVPRVSVSLPSGEEQLPPEDQKPHQQWVIEGNRLGSAPVVTVSKKSPSISFATATWHFSTDQLPKSGTGSLLRVERRYFLRSSKGTSTTLIPIDPSTQLHVGDEVEVQLQVSAAHGAEYVHLRDPRAAGFEPTALSSGYRYDSGLGFYEEIRDSGENFFFDWLPAGEYTLRYHLRATAAGTFRNGPATLQSMYAPEFTGYSSGTVLEIR